MEAADSMGRDFVLADAQDLLREMTLANMSGTPGGVSPVRIEGLVAGGPTKTSGIVHLCEGSRTASAAGVSPALER